ncbi:DNA polymerase III subunit gamma/tau [Corynebacterium sp. HMSC08D02]|uniref:DNA polymerase III subunit gamma and tau n=1 Tax=Corynebacterium sp. HMSC08D02 TaxID=1581138 RepID=UPI0008A5EB77|nr:DNA polymerase III subunit gamma and tau [Corynebacterium sp. HMSC08D02]OFT30912.1 DNA polymerase III subunit gamma/tau [Corynebacterium sp. HMSC08D02]
MALYRKYRPATFGELVGQDQVTVPLSNALDNGRISHAYLFSGPRGCGKTSSARILARSLNCVEGPTSTPCGKCASCVSLAPGGTGNLDVMELDAASHGGVDDMRELRERAMFAPAESRYRVFIIDEAHMISPSGNNALLKIVEEPPEHLIFIFATTEPEKILGTIRSRTHNYPFRLLTPQAMRHLLENIVAEEGAFVDENVYPLVIRAGGGSPRDTLSVLDQLLAGAGPDGLTYEMALPLLGVTDLTLLDAAIDALATKDAAAMFHTIDKVIESGHEPRRFALDLLDRLRDLLLIVTVPDAFGEGLVDAPVDRAEILRAQAQQFHPSTLAALATEVNDRIADLRGATSPRLLLEVMMAHLLTMGDRPAVSSATSAAPAPATPAQAAQPAQPAPSQTPSQGGGAAAAAAAAARIAERRKAQNTPKPEPKPEPAAKPEHKPEPKPEPKPVPQPPAEPATPPKPEPTPAPKPEPAPAEDLLERVQRDWMKLRQAVGKRNQVAEIMLAEAKPLSLDNEDGQPTLLIGHNTGALAERLNADNNNGDIVAVFSEALGTKVAVRCVVGTKGAKGASKSEATPKPAAQQPTDWRAIAKAAGQRSAQQERREREEVPPPPEPPHDDAGWEPPPPPPEPYSQEDEERDMVDQAEAESATFDRRDATEVAMDLLASELGAKPL